VTQAFPAKQSCIGEVVRFAEAKPAHPVRLQARSIDVLFSKTTWRDREYREAYLEASIDQGIAWQIKINRKRRKLSQAQLAKALGTQQSAISRLEDPEYGSYKIETLIEIAKTFDCALMVKFVPYSKLAEDSLNLTEEAQFAIPYSTEVESFNG